MMKSECLIELQQSHRGIQKIDNHNNKDEAQKSKKQLHNQTLSMVDTPNLQNLQEEEPLGNGLGSGSSPYEEGLNKTALGLRLKKTYKAGE